MTDLRSEVEAVEQRTIRVVGARQHNLRNVSLEIPRDKLVVLTGMSGSGKSSLAFDTIYAEGQRKYVESLSVHARMFLEQVGKPDVDRIEGLPPTTRVRPSRRRRKSTTFCDCCSRGSVSRIARSAARHCCGGRWTRSLMRCWHCRRNRG
jgi:excinuclease UvrABC ATPase subunit